MTSAPTINPDRIPPEMAALPQWVYATTDKVPRRVRDGLNASPTNPDHWAPFAEATEVVTTSRNGFRLGFVLTTSDNVVFIDLDKCRNPETGEINQRAIDIVARLPPGTYVEISASGTGIHIFGTSTRPLPPRGRKRPTIEMYDTGRYAMMTGDTLPGHDRLTDITEVAAALHAETWPPTTPRQPQTVSGGCLTGATIEDTEVLERARGARNGAKFDRLWGGDVSGHAGDESAADLALVSMLTFWTSDPDQLDRVFRLSGLYREEKWGTRADYRERTIRRALERSETYSPPPRPVIRPNHQDGGLPPAPHCSTADTPTDLAALRVLVLDLRAEVADLRGQVDDERRARLTAEARADRSARLQSVTMAALRSRNLGNEKHLAVATAFDLAAKLGGIDTEPESDAAFAVPLARLGDQIGASEHTVSAGLKKLDRLNIFDRQVRWVPERVDAETGELTGGHKATFLVPKVSPLEMLRVIATAPPDPISGKKNGHGGRRIACPDHPTAGTVKRWKLHCRDCDRLLEQGEDVIRPDAPPDTAPGLNHQDGTLVADAESVADPGDQTTEYTPPVVDHFSWAPFGQSSSAPAGTIAAEWMTGGRSHPPGEPGGRSPWDPDMSERGWTP